MKNAFLLYRGKKGWWKSEDHKDIIVHHNSNSGATLVHHSGSRLPAQNQNCSISLSLFSKVSTTNLFSCFAHLSFSVNTHPDLTLCSFSASRFLSFTTFEDGTRFSASHVLQQLRVLMHILLTNTMVSTGMMVAELFGYQIKLISKILNLQVLCKCSVSCRLHHSQWVFSVVYRHKSLCLHNTEKAYLLSSPGLHLCALESP